MSEKITKEQIKESIRSMTVMDLAELVKELEEEFGVSAMAPVAAAMPGAAAAEDSKKEEPTEFDVILKDCGISKIPVIKEVRAATSLGLKEAKELVEAGGKAVKEKLPKDEAEELKSKLEKVGAVVELLPSK